MGAIRALVKRTYGSAAAFGKAFALVLAPVVANAEVTVAVLGDSLTHGFGLPPEAGFVPQMQNWLTAQGAEVTLINAGVSGDTTAGGLSRAAWTLTPEVDVLIVALGGNDLLRGIDPAASKTNLSGILQVAKDAGVQAVLVGMEAPGNYGPDYKATFDAIYPALAKDFDAPLIPTFFMGYPEGGLAEVQPLMQADGIHPNADGVKTVVEAMGPLLLPIIAGAGGCPKGC